MLNEHLLLAVNTGIRAGQRILENYHGEIEAIRKEDNSPVTAADHASNSIIVSQLQRTGIPILSEEGPIADYEERKDWKQFWCVDPLDGTKGFIKRNGEFAVNIALIEGNYPKEGIIYAPTTGELVYTFQTEAYLAKSTSPFGNLNDLLDQSKKAVKRSSEHPYVIFSSRHNEPSLLADYLEQKKKEGIEVKEVFTGSAIKFMRLAQGLGNAYPRFQGSMEWDIAPGQAIVEKMGFKVSSIKTSKRLGYNKKHLLNDYFIIE